MMEQQDARGLFQSSDRQRRTTIDKKTDNDDAVGIPTVVFNIATESGTSTPSKPKRKICMPNKIKKKIGTKLVPNDCVSSLHDDEDTIMMADADVTYLSLLRDNRPFRFFILSYIVAHLGEWLTYLASISAIEEIQLHNGADASSRMALSLLIVIRLLPNVILSPFGGALADGWDRRDIMMILDVCGSLVAWIFVFALHQKSVGLIYFATFLQECIAGLYEPSRSAIIPLMCPGDEEMKKATTLAGVVWSMIAAFGSAAGGFLVALVGIHGCYKIDFFTYLLSAALMYVIGGTWTVEKKKTAFTGTASQSMVMQGIQYLRNSFFGPLVLLKAAAFIICGANDVLNVSYSERGSLDHRSTRLGMLFGSVGVGCFIGPLFTDKYNDMHNPKVIQTICLFGFAVMAVGCVMMGIATEFWMVLFSSAFRSMGCSVVWINSSLLLQKFCAPDMLGRIASIDYSAALLTEGLSAVLAGLLQDRYGLSAEEVSLLQGVACTFLLIAWCAYHFKGGGAASYYEDEKEETSTVASTDIESDPEMSTLMVPLYSSDS